MFSHQNACFGFLLFYALLFSMLIFFCIDLFELMYCHKHLQPVCESLWKQIFDMCVGCFRLISFCLYNSLRKQLIIYKNSLCKHQPSFKMKFKIHFSWSLLNSRFIKKKEKSASYSLITKSKTQSQCNYDTRGSKTPI
jgi:hypothetical protein